MDTTSRECEQWLTQEKGRAQQAWLNTDLARQNSETLDKINDDGELLDSFNHNNHTYEFRTSKARPRGVLARRSLWKDKGWEIVLDVQKLSDEENEAWSYQQITCLSHRCLIGLSKNGSEKVVFREFDLNKKTFVQDGFFIPEGFHTVVWVDLDSLYVTAATEHEQLTQSGHPRHLRLWKRHQAFEDAKILHSLQGYEEFHALDHFSIEDTEVLVDLVCRDYYSCEAYFRFGNGPFHRLPLKMSVSAQGAIGPYIILKTQKPFKQKDGKLIPPGSLLAWHRRAITSAKAQYQIIWLPTDQQTLGEVHIHENAMLLQIHEHSKTTLERIDFAKGKVDSGPRFEVKDFADINITNVVNRKNSWWIYAESFLHSRGQFLLQDKKIGPPQIEREFDYSEDYEVQQLWAHQKGLDPVPYLLIQSKSRDRSKKAPTIMEVYGGFDSVDTPSFVREKIELWVQHGGAYVVPLIRGSAERGWRANVRTKGPSDLGAKELLLIAEDLIRNQITDANHLGLFGSSNAGRWIVLAAFLRPDLFKAVSCQSCIIDLVHASSWGYGKIYRSEYGDADNPRQLSLMKNFSPLHVQLAEGTKLPAFLIVSTSHDDRVVPLHSQRLAEKLSQYGGEYYLFEFPEGGHELNKHYEYSRMAGTANWSFLQSQLGLRMKELAPLNGP